MENKSPLPRIKARETDSDTVAAAAARALAAANRLAPLTPTEGIIVKVLGNDESSIQRAVIIASNNLAVGRVRRRQFDIITINMISDLNIGRGGLESGRGPNMGRFRPSFVRLVYFLRKSTEFHVNRTECQRILFHFLLLIFS